MTPRPYPAYKDSGVEWLGEVPSHWDLLRVRDVATCNDDVLTEATPADREIEYVEISGVDAERGIVERSVMNFGDAPSRARRRVQDGDVLVSTVRTYLRSIAPVIDPPEELVVSTGFAVVRPRDVVSGFLSYLFRSEFLIGEIISRSVGVSYPAINASEIMRLHVALPPLPEQSAISAFLDRETGKMDTLIAEQEKLIELLREKRQAAISNAVTKGLDPTVPMKDSGIEWLGEVPEHWEVKQLKWLVTFQRGYDLPSDSREEGDVPIVSSGGISGFHSVPAAHGPAIVTGRYGTIGQFRLVHGPFWPLNTALYSTDLRSTEPRYATYLLRHLSPLFILNAVKSAVPGVDRNDIHPLPSPCPSAVEQTAIADFLDRVAAETDALIAEAQNAVELLRERRAALISAAVTGKIDVRQPSAEIIPFTPRQRRNILAAEVISVCHLDHTFGRTKAQKAFYLLERHLGIEEMDGRYERYVYGPYDGQQLDSIASDLESAEWFREVPLDGRSIYRPLAKADEIGGVFEQAWGGRRAEIGELIGLLRPLDTQQAEVIATLFAAWNDFLLGGQTIDDDALITDVRTNWHPSKLLIPIEKWHFGLRWMRENKVVPRGVGRPTIYQTSLL